MRNRTLTSIVSLTMLLALSDAGSQSILDLQRIEGSKTSRRAQETKIPEWTNRNAAPRRSEEIERLSASHGNPISSRDNSILDSARIEWVRYLNSESLPGTAVANDVAVDAAGNVYVTGKSESAGSAFDILTMKYDPFGDLLWTARYDGPAHGIDIGNAIAVDASGNVLVTGLSVGADSSGYDYLTIKYNNVGVEQWVARYNGLANSSDGAVALELDDDGSVYVTGSSAGSFHDWAYRYDYATIKYDPSGTELWVARYNGPLEWGEDEATALALDQWGNVYVTGSSEDTIGRAPWGGTTDELHYTTIKYTPQGVAAWVKRYDTSDTVNAIPTSIAVDDSGNVIVTGISIGYIDGHTDILTVKYTSQGNQQWTAARARRPRGQFHQTTGLAVDKDGNVYVAGVNYGNGLDSLITIKYNASGIVQWAAGFTSSSNALQMAELALDETGNVYVVGSNGHWGSEGFVGTEILTLKYRNDGSLEWNRSYAAPGITSNRATAIAIHTRSASESDIIVTGGSGSLGFSTIEYDAAGSQRWAGQAGGERLCMDYVLHTEIDDQGSIYIVGEAQGLNSRVDYVVAKYNSAGVQMWSSRFNNSGEFTGNISDMAVDANGNVYLCGWVYDYTTLRDYVTVKFNAAGEQEWVARYSAQAGSYDDMAMGIGVDANGNAYVTGLGTSASGWKMTTVKYDQTGNEIWVARSNDPGSGWDIAVDNAGFVYAAGLTSPEGPSPFYFTVIKYDPAGTEVWAAQTEASLYPYFFGLAIDDIGNAYVTGYGSSVKFTNMGAFAWRVAGWGNDILLDGHGGVYFPYYGSSVIKYTTEGAYQWSYTRNALSPIAVDVDMEGNAFILGFDYSHPLWAAQRLVCVNSLGQEKWSTVYPAQGDEDVFPGRVEADATGNVYLACETGLGGSSRITLVKYNQVVVSVDKEPEPAPVGFGLSQNYPNPFNPSTKIQFSLPRSGVVTLKVYNTLGEEVVSLLEGERTAGVYTLEWNANGFASGVYFYRLKTGEYSETKKLLLLK